VKVLLVVPTALDDTGAPIRQRRLYLPGLTMPVLAAVSPPGVEIRIVFDSVEPIPYAERFDLVGITGMGSGIVRAWQIAARFREAGTRVVLGGIAATLGDEALAAGRADSVVLGEAEELWPQVLADAAAGRLQPVYRAARFTPMEDLPVPRYDLLDRRKIGFWLPVQASRGCPRACRFCSVTAFFGGGYRTAPVENVLRDVRAIKARGIRHVAIIDDNIAGDPDQAARLLEALVPERIVWMSQATLELAEDRRLLELAARSGCKVLSFGIESTSEESLAWAGKNFNRPERYAEAIRRVREAGIEVSTEMMVGLDGDDAGVFDRTVRFLMENRISVPRIHIVTPVPGTPLWAELERQGRILVRDLESFTGGKVVFRPKRMSADELQRGFWSMYERLFGWRAIAHRLGRNPSRLGPLLRAFVAGVNLHYRGHVRRRICPGIV
jgi:radical SAM superfamily enzyme YgiQ (UPF0313 family)